MNPRGKGGTLSFKSLLVTAAWFGLVTGLVEGAGLLGFQNLGWLNWNMEKVAVSAEIVWIAALFDLLLFSILAPALAAAVRLFPRLPWPQPAVFCFSLLTFFDWLAFIFWRRTLSWVAAVALLALVGTQSGLWLGQRMAVAQGFPSRIIRARFPGVQAKGSLLPFSATHARFPATPLSRCNVLMCVARVFALC